MRVRIDTRPWGLALLWLALLTPFFFASYRFANWVTGLRPDVPSVVFAWERHIPFLPWTIFPYWSTDLLYGLSLFVCSTREELNTHGRRLLLAQVLSVAGFLLFPLRFSFAVPHADGLAGRLFAELYSFDRPFNQAPSLHLSLTVLLWSLYSRHLRGPALWAMRAWMILVGISTLTTYQHHFIDLPAGIWVGLVVIALLPFEVGQAPGLRGSRGPASFRIAFRYLLGAAILVVLPGWVLLWPAGALLLVALIYLSGNPDYFRKHDGAHAAPVIALLAPYLVAARWNLRFWTRGDAPAHEIADGVWLGQSPQRAQRDRYGIASLVDLAPELNVDITGVRYAFVPMLDRLAPASSQLTLAVAAIDAFAPYRPTLVCCAAGYSRGAAAVAAWLLASGRAASAAEAIDFIRARRPRIAPVRATMGANT